MKPWKVQRYFGDLVYDLRSRNLLPVAVILVAAIVAVPILLSRGGEDPPPPPETVDIAAAELAPETQAAVLAYDPGLRSYRKRLDELNSKDPFKQQFAGSQGDGAALGDALATTVGAASLGAPVDSGGTGGADVETIEDAPVDSGSKTKAKGKSKGKSEVRYQYYEVDVAVGDATAPLVRRNRVAPFTYLPSSDLPVLVYVGYSPGGERAFFVVSSEVQQVLGPAVCMPSNTDCGLLSLRAGEAEDLVHANGVTYRVHVPRIKRVVSSKPPAGV